MFAFIRRKLVQPGDYVDYLASRWKWSVKGVGGTCSLVSFAAGAALAIALWLWPDWAHEHISERMNAFILGLIPLAAGASVFLLRWVCSSYAVFKVEKANIIALQGRRLRIPV